MTFLEKIEPHLVSEDILIQEFVLHSIHDYPFIPEDWTNQLLKEAFRNNEKFSSILIYIDNQPLNEEALNILLHHIPEVDKSNVHLVLKLLDRVEPEMALKYKEQLEGYVRKDMWTLYELLVQGSKEEVFAEYGKMLNKLERAQSYQHDDYVKAKKLAACIAKKGWVTEDEIETVIEEEMHEEWFTFKGILHVYMVGLLKLERFIPVLSFLLDRDDDILLEEVSAALISFQSDKVVETVSPYLHNEESIIYASSIIENIKTDLAVDALREAYQKSDNDVNKDLLFEALSHQLSTKAIPEISKHMEQEYFTTMVDIEQTVYSYYSILGQEHPELRLWKQAALGREMDYKQQLHVPNKAEKKIGRNEPCPCGSGKKYKKCCGK